MDGCKAILLQIKAYHVLHFQCYLFESTVQCLLYTWKSVSEYYSSLRYKSWAVLHTCKQCLRPELTLSWGVPPQKEYIHTWIQTGSWITRKISILYFLYARRAQCHWGYLLTTVESQEKHSTDRILLILNIPAMGCVGCVCWGEEIHPGRLVQSPRSWQPMG